MYTGYHDEFSDSLMFNKLSIYLARSYQVSLLISTHHTCHSVTELEEKLLFIILSCFCLFLLLEFCIMKLNMSLANFTFPLSRHGRASVAQFAHAQNLVDV